VHKRRKKRFFVKATILLVLAGGVMVGWWPSLVKSEAFGQIYQYIIYDRILLPVYLTLTTPEENIRTTRLPVYELEIKGKYIDELNEDITIPEPSSEAERPLLDGPINMLPPSCLEYKPAVFRHNGLRYRVQVRYRGDNYCHFLGPAKSWRVKFKKSDRFENQRLINLINPKHKSMTTSHLGYVLAEKIGLLVPRSHLSHFVVNRTYEGVSLFVEQIDEYFMINHGLTEGNIYYGEQRGIWQDPNLWDRRVISVENPDKNSPDELERFLRTIQLESDEDFKRGIGKILDVDYWMSVFSHSLLTADFHRDDFHNHKYYYDPTCGLFRTIIWDPLGYGWSQENCDPTSDIKLNMASNTLSGRMLQIPEFAERKNIRLYELLNGVCSLKERLAYHDELYELIKKDVYCDMRKDYNYGAPVRLYGNRAFEERMRHQRGWICVHTEELLRQLNISDCLICPDKAFEPHPVGNTGESAVASYLFFNSGECGVRLSVVRLYPTVMEDRGDDLQMASKSDEPREGKVADSDAIGIMPAEGVSEGVSRQYRLYYDSNNNQRIDAADMLLDTATWAEGGESILFSFDRPLLPGRKKVPSPDTFINRNRYLPYNLVHQYACHRLMVSVSGNQGQVVSGDVAGDYFRPLGGNDIKAVIAVTGRDVAVKASAAGPGEYVKGALPFDVEAESRIVETVVWGPGVHQVGEDMILPRTTQLIIKPGSTVQFGPGASLLCYGPVLAEGSAQDPIIIRAAQQDKPWGVFALQGKGANDSRFAHCHFSEGRDDWLDNVFYSGMLCAYNCDVTIENCLISKAYGDDGVNFKFADNGSVRQTVFRDNSADALDLDFSDCLVEDCRFVDNANDGIDIGSSSATIRNNTIIGCGDKGISAGEMSRPRIYNNTIRNNNVAVASKDMSRLVLVNNMLIDNNTAIVCYQKKAKFGPSAIELTNCVITGNKTALSADMNSSISIHHCQLPSGTVISPLPGGIAEDPVAPTEMVRPITGPLMDISDNFDQTASVEVLVHAGDVGMVREIIGDYEIATAPIGLLGYK
jgi:parallel beta-helix repeat protein